MLRTGSITIRGPLSARIPRVRAISKARAPLFPCRPAPPPLWHAARHFMSFDRQAGIQWAAFANSIILQCWNGRGHRDLLTYRPRCQPSQIVSALQPDRSTCFSGIPHPEMLPSSSSLLIEENSLTKVLKQIGFCMWRITPFSNQKCQLLGSDGH